MKGEDGVKENERERGDEEEEDKQMTVMGERIRGKRRQEV